MCVGFYLGLVNNQVCIAQLDMCRFYFSGRYRICLAIVYQIGSIIRYLRLPADFGNPPEKPGTIIKRKRIESVFI
jgi:hypothetical protein